MPEMWFSHVISVKLLKSYISGPTSLQSGMHDVQCEAQFSLPSPILLRCSTDTGGWELLCYTFTESHTDKCQLLNLSIWLAQSPKRYFRLHLSEIKHTMLASLCHPRFPLPSHPASQCIPYRPLYLNCPYQMLYVLTLISPSPIHPILSCVTTR